jgi:hypothetical protein
MNSISWERIGAAAGIIFSVLQKTAHVLMQVGGKGTPFNASADTVAAFFLIRRASSECLAPRTSAAQQP